MADPNYPYIDPNTTTYTFDAESDLPYPGTWFRLGAEDAQNGFSPRVLQAPFDVMQFAYNQGFAEGQYLRSYYEPNHNDNGPYAPVQNRAYGRGNFGSDKYS